MCYIETGFFLFSKDLIVDDSEEERKFADWERDENVDTVNSGV